MESRLTFSAAQWELVLAALVATLFALVAGFVYALTTKNELGVRYRPVAVISACIQLVAVLSFVALTVSWIVGFDVRGGSYVPNEGFTFDPALRYFDWAVSVPLLTAELVGISVLAGAAALKTRAVLMTSAALMVVAGFLGEGVFGDKGTDDTSLLVWGAISTVPFVVAYLGIFRVCQQSARELPDDVGRSFRNVGLLFALTWGVYPLGYLVPVVFDDSPGWAVARQVGFSLATIAAKVGFGVLAHKIGVLRTAYDLQDATQTHDDDVWHDSVKLAEARPAVGHHLERFLVEVPEGTTVPSVYPEERATRTRTPAR